MQKFVLFVALPLYGAYRYKSSDIVINDGVGDAEVVGDAFESSFINEGVGDAELSHDANESGYTLNTPEISFTKPCGLLAKSIDECSKLCSAWMNTVVQAKPSVQDTAPLGCFLSGEDINGRFSGCWFSNQTESGCSSSEPCICVSGGQIKRIWHRRRDASKQNFPGGRQGSHWHFPYDGPDGPNPNIVSAEDSVDGCPDYSLVPRGGAMGNNAESCPSAWRELCLPGKSIDNNSHYCQCGPPTDLKARGDQCYHCFQGHHNDTVSDIYKHGDVNRDCPPISRRQIIERALGWLANGFLYAHFKDREDFIGGTPETCAQGDKPGCPRYTYPGVCNGFTSMALAGPSGKNVAADHCSDLIDCIDVQPGDQIIPYNGAHYQLFRRWVDKPNKVWLIYQMGERENGMPADPGRDSEGEAEGERGNDRKATALVEVWPTNETLLGQMTCRARKNLQDYDTCPGRPTSPPPPDAQQASGAFRVVDQGKCEDISGCRSASSIGDCEAWALELGKDGYHPKRDPKARAPACYLDSKNDAVSFNSASEISDCSSTDRCVCKCGEDPTFAPHRLFFGLLIGFVVVVGAVMAYSTFTAYQSRH